MATKKKSPVAGKSKASEDQKATDALKVVLDAVSPLSEESRKRVISAAVRFFDIDDPY